MCTMGTLLEKLKNVETRTEARVVILAGQGSAFSAGHNLAELVFLYRYTSSISAIISHNIGHCQIMPACRNQYTISKLMINASNMELLGIRMWS